MLKISHPYTISTWRTYFFGQVIALYEKSVLYEEGLAGHLLHIPKKDMLAQKNRVMHLTEQDALVSYEHFASRFL